MMPLRIITSSVRGIQMLTSSQLTNPSAIASSSVYASTHPITSSERSVSNSWVHQTKRDLFISATSQRSFFRSAYKSEKFDLPAKPKKPVTAWIMYVRQRKDALIREMGNVSASKLSVVLAKEWRDMDKTSYEEEYRRLHNQYKREKENYEASLTDDQRHLLHQQRLAKSHNKALKQLKATNPPKFPRNAANLYVQEKMVSSDAQSLLKTHKPGQVLKKVINDYNSLSESEKEKYLQMQKEDKLRFQHEFLLWYESIQNHEHLTKAARDMAHNMREKLLNLDNI